jgi:hypothetical protein
LPHSGTFKGKSPEARQEFLREKPLFLRENSRFLRELFGKKLCFFGKTMHFFGSCSGKSFISSGKR